jgi:PEP-CTERM motif
MKRLFLITTAALIALGAPEVSNAAIQNLAISGNLDGHDYTGTLSLDVNGGQAVSGSGTLSILGLKNAPIVLITASTPGNEGGPIGFRANDGTDYFGLDQAYPISTNGLLFDVGTTTAQWGLDPLFAIWSEGTGYAAAFTGNVGGTEYYNLQGSAMASATGAVPEPSTWAMLGIGFVGLGLAGWRKTRTNRLAVAV